MFYALLHILCRLCNGKTGDKICVFSRFLHIWLMLLLSAHALKKVYVISVFLKFYR